MASNDLPFNSVLGLSKQNDGCALTALAVSEFKAHFGLSQATVLEVSGGDGAAEPVFRQFDERPGAERQRVDLSGCTDALQKKQVTAVQTGFGDRLVVPVASSNGPRRVIVLDGVDADPTLRLQLMQLAELYGSQIALLDSRERDQLTGLLNRQSFERYFLTLAENNAVNDRFELYLAVLDIDHFKRVNDTYGHLYGDEVLLHFSQIMKRTFRYTDYLFRFGGEEFIVLLTVDGDGSAVEPLDRFRKAVEAFDFPGVGKVTVSIGFTDCAADKLPTKAIDRADRALYYAKENGRNRVVDALTLGPESDDHEGDVQLF